MAYPEPDKDSEDSKSMLQLECAAEIHDPRRKALRLRLEAILSGSTISGVSQAFSDRTRNYKIFWIVLFALGVVGFVVNFFFITKHFVSRPILTQLDRSDRPFKWPHLTFCNPSNPIPMWMSEQVEAKWNETYIKAHDYSLPGYGLSKRKIWEHYVAMSSINPAEFFREEQRSMILQVKVAHEQSSIASSSGLYDQYMAVTDLPGIFHSRLDSIRSPIPCYTLMPEKISEALGLTDKLLAIKLYLIVDYRGHLIYDYGYESRKLYFYVTNADSTLQSTFPEYILAGTDSFFTLKQRMHERVSHCIDETFSVELYDAVMGSTKKYNGGYDDCRTFISQRLFVERCGCFNPQLPIYKLSEEIPRLCTNMSIYNEKEMRTNVECLNSIMREDQTTKSFKFQLALTCSKYLQSPCVSNTYGVTRNSNAWQEDMNELRHKEMKRASSSLPNARRYKERKGYILQNTTEKFIRQNMVILNIVAGKDSTEFTEEEFEYPLSQFMSDFGGAIGLWIGLSIISFFEIMELVIVFVKYLRS